MSISKGSGRCPICFHVGLLELVEPGGAVLCPECGLVLNWFRDYFRAAGITDLVTGETSLQNLGADSLDIVELVMELETEFEVQIPDEEAERIRTIGDVIRHVVQRWHAADQVGAE